VWLADVGGQDAVAPMHNAIAEDIDHLRGQQRLMPFRPADITLVIPTFNERRNLDELVRRVAAALGERRWELVFVDDNSPDGTAAAAKVLARNDPRVRVIRRIDRRGLAGACIEGMLSSSAPLVGVMDGDLQHDETILPQMIDRFERPDIDLVVGSRHVEGGSAGSGFSPLRARMSGFAIGMAQRVFGTDLSDIMSGFFVMRRDVFEEIAPRLTSSGFKILADIVGSASKPLGIEEVGYTFRARQEGESKFDSKIVLDFAGLILNKVTRGLVPVRFIFFAVVGSVGVLVHLVVLKAALSVLHLGFGPAQTVAAFVAMTANFVLNNLTTYRDARLRGWRLFGGLLGFYAICGVGVIANVGVSTLIYRQDPVWWLAGLVGVVMGAVWNYTLSSLFVWRRAA
jgi:dolichol-phosphate mannosyltransferase